MATRILIVDDDVELAGLLRELLEPEGYAVDTHGTGRGAAERAAGGGYALVILDVMLPEVNGFEILRLVRRTRSRECQGSGPPTASRGPHPS